jgi:hypothetical protein
MGTMTSSFDLLFSPPKEIEFLDKKFDFEINPDHFIEWLKKEEQEVTGDYKIDVSTMCEYSCLYVGMMLHDTTLQGEMKIHYGKFGFWEHYWLGYTFEGQEYFIDLTLRQFNQNAPKLAISKAINERVAGCYSSLSEGTSIEEYIQSKRAFEFYTNPKTMEKPIIKKFQHSDFSLDNPFSNIKL